MLPFKELYQMVYISAGFRWDCTSRKGERMPSIYILSSCIYYYKRVFRKLYSPIYFTTPSESYAFK